MAKTKIKEKTWGKVPNAFHFAAMQAFDGRLQGVTSENEMFKAARTKFRTQFVAEDQAYKNSLLSFSTKNITELDHERDVYANVTEQVAKQWAKLPDDALNIHGRRVAQVFKDFKFRSTEALVAENAKIKNIEQKLSTDYQCELALKAMGLTDVNKKTKELTEQIERLMTNRNEEASYRVAGELKEARAKSDEVYAETVELVNALIIATEAYELEEMARLFNADIAKIEQQIAQSRKRPTDGEKKDDEPDVEPEDVTSKDE